MLVHSAPHFHQHDERSCLEASPAGDIAETMVVEKMKGALLAVERNESSFEMKMVRGTRSLRPEGSEIESFSWLKILT